MKHVIQSIEDGRIIDNFRKCAELCELLEKNGYAYCGTQNTANVWNMVLYKKELSVDRYIVAEVVSAVVSCVYCSLVLHTETNTTETTFSHGPKKEGLTFEEAEKLLIETI